MTFLIVRALHLVLMALWLTASVLALLEALTLTHTVRENAKVRAAHDRRLKLLGIVSGAGTIITGLVMIALLGGFTSVPWAIHAALGVAIVMYLVGGFGVGRTSHQVSELLDQGTPAAELREHATRLLRWSSLLVGLWSVEILLMVFRRFV